jgi:hypothetical protein
LTRPTKRTFGQAVLFAFLLVACDASGGADSTPSTTTDPGTSPSTPTLAGTLDCEERAVVMEPSGLSYATAIEAEQSTLLEATPWSDAVLEEIETNQWVGTVDDRRVVRFRTFPTNDGTWGWVELEYC